MGIFVDGSPLDNSEAKGFEEFTKERGIKSLVKNYIDLRRKIENMRLAIDQKEKEIKDIVNSQEEICKNIRISLQHIMDDFNGLEGGKYFIRSYNLFLFDDGSLLVSLDDICSKFKDGRGLLVDASFIDQNTIDDIDGYFEKQLFEKSLLGIKILVDSRYTLKSGDA